MLITGPQNLMQRVWKPGDLIQRGRYNAPVAGIPVNTVAPAITGTLGVGNLLTTTTGTWTGAGITFTGLWRRDGVDIPGTNSLTYTQVTADIGAFIDCFVTATNIAGAVDAFSNVVGPVPGPASLVDFSQPPVTGSLSTDTAISGGWQIDTAAGSNNSAQCAWPCNLVLGTSYTFSGTLKSLSGQTTNIQQSSGVNSFFTTSPNIWQTMVTPGVGVDVPLTGVRVITGATSLFVGFKYQSASAAAESYQVTNLSLVAT
jgi:hypothetical protein